VEGEFREDALVRQKSSHKKGRKVETEAGRNGGSWVLDIIWFGGKTVRMRLILRRRSFKRLGAWKSLRNQPTWRAGGAAGGFFSASLLRGNLIRGGANRTCYLEQVDFAGKMRDEDWGPGFGVGKRCGP